MTTQRVFCYDQKRPWRNIFELDAEVKPGPKWAWAISKGADGSETRRLLGATAFFTRASAERAKIGYLTKLVKCRALAHTCHSMYDNAMSQIEEFRATGTVH